jgi:hypothetical protein
VEDLLELRMNSLASFQATNGLHLQSGIHEDDEKTFLARSALLPSSSGISAGMLCGSGAGKTLCRFRPRRQYVF